jgi:hypothetical protein
LTGLRRATVVSAIGCATVGAFSGCAARGVARNSPRSDYGIPRCPPSAAGDLVGVMALQCWFTAPHGRWRVLGHDSHFNVLVVQVEAADLADAEAITQQFVDNQRERWSELLVYVQQEGARDVTPIRRVRWTPESGFELLDIPPQL